MPHRFPRSARLGDLFKREIATMTMTNEIKDPRIHGLVTIMHVDVSKDLKHAKVYVSVMGTEEEKSEVLSAFVHAAPFIRRMLGSRLRLKKIPDLCFELDRTVDDHFRIESLLDSNKWKREA